MADQVHDMRALRVEMDTLITKAAAEEIPLSPSDFKIIDGELTLDGMPAAEWIDAMTMD